MTNTIAAIGWTLIHFCWQATAIAVVYWLLSFWLDRRSSQTRYLAALTAMLLMMSAAVCTFAWEAHVAPPPYSLADANARIANTLAAPVFPRVAVGVLNPPSQSEVRQVLVLSAGMLRWIDAIWILGVLLLSLRSMGGWWMIHRLRMASELEAPEAVRACFERMTIKLGLRRPVLLRVTSAIAGPVTIGALRAMVLLPLSALTALGPDELEVVLAHELAHVRRADFFWNLVQTLAETLFFFHPAVWWIGSRIRHEREICCDDLALQFCPDAVIYANALFRLEEQRVRHWRFAMALDGHQSSHTLRMRIARIIDAPAQRIRTRPMQPFSWAVAGIALLVLLIPGPQVMASLKAAPAPVVAHVIAPVVHVAKPRAIHPVPAAVSTFAIDSNAAQQAAEAQSSADQQEKSSADAASAKRHLDYIDSMKAAGYDVDLDKYIAMKIQGVTPEYAKAMADIYGKLSADDLVACKIQGVTPEYVAKLKADGLAIDNLHDVISYRIFNVTPEFVAGMKTAGFYNLDSKKLLELRVQGVTPEYAQQIKQQFPGATVDDIVKTKIFRIDGDFIAQAKRHGFNDLTLDKLVKLRISGVLDDESAK
ncbi:MAG TPA: M56 family metallopeptidase [Terracidiphilus sp.]|nr:M56 family metallopeptidase [Terracidiphilus sp.]